MIDSNLTLTGYGVTLRRLTHDKIEMLRQWRNDPKIQQYMVYRDYITPEMQEAWFQKINNDKNLYCIIEFDGKEVGLINVKDIDYEKGVGEGGVFVVEERLLNTDVAYRAHLLLFDFVFKELGLQGIKSRILLSNQRAVRFAQFLGSEQKGEEDGTASLLLTKENFLANKNRMHFLKRWKHFNGTN